MGRISGTDTDATDASGRAATSVAVTFDTEHPDRPSYRGGGTDRVLSALADAGVRATFFVQGRWAMSEPDLVQQMADDGHLVGNHSFDHVRFDELDERQIGEQLRRTHEALTTILSHEPSKWLRLPYHSGIGDADVIRSVRRFGYHPVYRHVAPKDWDTEISTQQLLDESLAQAEARPVTVLNLHNWPLVTAEGLPAIIDGYRALGATFVTVDEVPVATIDEMLPQPARRSGGRRVPWRR
jgi:peptidoglycan-N-acetylmuramic acid deacetylase